MKKFSAIDYIIVFVVMLTVVFTFAKTRKAFIDNQKVHKIHFSVLSSYIDKDSQDVVKVGDKVQISLKETVYATVINVTEKEYFADSFNPKLKRFVSKAVETKSDILFDLECDATVSDAEILCGDNFPLRVGNAAYIQGKGYTFHGFIVSVNDLEE